MKEENIKIKAFFLNELNIKVRLIKAHRDHDLAIKKLLPTKEKNGLMMMINLICLDCKKMGKYPIQGDKNYLTSLSGLPVSVLVNKYRNCRI